MKATKKLKADCQEINSIIHSQNLYGPGSNGNRARYIHARIVDGKIFVENLYSGQLVEFNNSDFTNGYGSTVAI